MTGQGVFDRFAPFVRDFVYEHDWEALRAIQVAAADAILNSEANVLLSSSTASGKTEAAFFPVLTQLWEDPPTSVGCLYVAPLKSLINDQFYRLEDLCEEGGIPVWHWHGDVSASHKARLMKRPSGILQITPESLEAMLIHRHAAIPRLFGDLRFVVIDEVHSLIRGDRGAQTFCLIERLSRMAQVSPRRIGLSATIGDLDACARILGAHSGRDTFVPRVDEGRSGRWRLSMQHFFTSGEQAAGEMPHSAGKEGPLANADPGLAYVFEHTHGRKCLVFSNSREECEEVTSTLRAYCERAGEPDRFLIHHGNLSASLRESAEELMREEELPLTTCTTSTLELGIDIGRLERAFQMDAPFTVSGFLQRMGRTGRRGQPPEMWFVMREDQPEPRSLLPETIPWKLLQGIALVQLYLEERWVEPPREGRLPYSLLYHQTMSTLASCGEQSPAELAGRVLSLAPFANVSWDDYRLLLRHLVEGDHIERTEGGGLIVGLAGERITSNYRFYGVFVESEEYAVRCEGQELGTVVQPPPAGERLAIAGGVWIVEEVDHRRRQVYVTQVRGRVPAYFGECAGDIHTRVLERMRVVLSEGCGYPYLRGNAAARLSSARRAAAAAGVCTSSFVSLGGDSWALFPWLGSYAFLALERAIKLRMPASLGIKGVDVSRPYFMQFRMAAEPGELVAALQGLFSSELDPMSLLFAGEVPTFDKYDEYLPPELVRKGFAQGVLDVAGARERVLQWAEGTVSPT